MGEVMGGRGKILPTRHSLPHVRRLAPEERSRGFELVDPVARRAVDADGRGRGRTSGTRSRWAESRLVWRTSRVGNHTSQAAWSSVTGANWWAKRLPNTRSRLLSVVGS